MENEQPKSKKWPLWAAIVALILSVLSLCGGWFIPYCSLLCPLLAIVLAALSLKTERKALSIIALSLAILSFLILASAGTLFWISSSTTSEGAAFGKSLGGLPGAIGNLFQSILVLIKNTLNIH
jgi:hypothetical protein